MLKNTMVALWLAIASFLLVLACDDATRSRTDSDTASTDTATVNDNDNLTPTDETTSDEIVTDEIVTDEILTDETVTDEETETPIVTDDTPVIPDDDTPPLTCDDIICDVENSHCEEGPNGAECACDEGYHWNSGQCVPDTLTETGTFAFDFSGVVNTTTDPQQLQMGEGTVTFSHLGQEFTYDEVNVFGNLGFPMASLQSGDTIMVVWIEGFSMGTIHFFGFSLPATKNTPGTKQMAASQAVATYGDMSFSANGAQIECIRAMSNDGSFTIADDTGNGTLHITTANGKLYDPAVLGGSLPAPICKK